MCGSGRALNQVKPNHYFLLLYFFLLWHFGLISKYTVKYKIIFLFYSLKKIVIKFQFHKHETSVLSFVVILITRIKLCPTNLIYWKKDNENQNHEKIKLLRRRDYDIYGTIGTLIRAFSSISLNEIGK
jgi:hypothetical protein